MKKTLLLIAIICFSCETIPATYEEYSEHSVSDKKYGEEFKKAINSNTNKKTIFKDFKFGMTEKQFDEHCHYLVSKKELTIIDDLDEVNDKYIGTGFFKSNYRDYLQELALNYYTHSAKMQFSNDTKDRGLTASFGKLVQISFNDNSLFKMTLVLEHTYNHFTTLNTDPGFGYSMSDSLDDLVSMYTKKYGDYHFNYVYREAEKNSYNGNGYPPSDILTFSWFNDNCIIKLVYNTRNGNKVEISYTDLVQENRIDVDKKADYDNLKEAKQIRIKKNSKESYKSI